MATMNRLRPSGRRGRSLPIGSVIGSYGERWIRPASSRTGEASSSGKSSPNCGLMDRNKGTA